MVVSMQALLAAGMGALAGFGLWLGITAARGVRVIPAANRLVPKAVPAERAAGWFLLAAGVGVVETDL